MTKISTSLSRIYNELIHETSWLGFNKTQKATYLVAVASILFSLLIFGMDKFFQEFIDVIFKQF